MIKIYNQIRLACKAQNFEEAIKLAGELEDRLKDTGNIYGWDKISLTGREDVDTVLKRLDPYLTGPRY